MAIPTYEDAMLPVLLVLADGKPQHRRNLADRMADEFALSAEERERMLPSGKSRVIGSRTGWALAYMKQAGLVTTHKRGWYEITELGRSVLGELPKRIDNAFLARFAEFRDFQNRSRSPNERRSEPVVPDPGVPFNQDAPDEAIERAYTSLRTATETELLDTLKTISPGFFEQVVIDVLVKMGYGGNQEDAARAVGRSGDGGIDGVIDEDRLGLDVIYVQAKRWDGVVGRPEIQKFAGALQGQRARKGIFITTSQFTRDAVEFARNIELRIVLIDGQRLASLMYEYEIGVTGRKTYTVKSLDGDYFEES